MRTMERCMRGSRGRHATTGTAMGTAELKWGAGLIGFAPAACLFLLVVTKRPELVIISIIGAFAYLVALLLSSIAWIAIPPLQRVAIVTVLVGVLCQGLMRAVLFRLYQRTELLIKSANHPILHMPLNDVTSSLAAGVGFGLMHCTMLFGSVLASQHTDPGVLYVRSCRGTPLVLVLAFLALAFTLLDLLLMALTFLYLRRRRPHRLWLALGLHAAVAAMTIFNELSDGCTVALPLVYALLAGAGVLAVREHRQLSLVGGDSI